MSSTVQRKNISSVCTGKPEMCIRDRYSYDKYVNKKLCEIQKVLVYETYDEKTFAGSNGYRTFNHLCTESVRAERHFQMCIRDSLTGGGDISPVIYGESTLPECGECCRDRDDFD